MNPPVPLPSPRRFAGCYGFLNFLALALLALLGVHALASSFRGHDPDNTRAAVGSTNHQSVTAEHDDNLCSGPFWDVCCRTSTTHRSPSGQMPIVFLSNSSSSYGDGDGDDTIPLSTLKKHTMKLVQPLLTLATGAWCSRLDDPQQPLSPQPPKCAATSKWPGSDSSQLQYIFSFGDSFTTTWFNWRDNPPSPSTPLGNPPYPGYTSASGANWIDYLTVKYNQTFLQTYNLAIGGAAVDQDINLAPPLFGLSPFEPERRSLKDQVQRDFITGYAYKNAPEAPGWDGSNSLFAIWIGINDVVGSYLRGPNGQEGTRALNDQIFRTYANMVEMLYDQGARNFMFLNVPAVDRSPVIMARGPRDVAWLSADLDDFNGRIVQMARRLKSQHHEVNAWVYDARMDFGKVLDDPRAFPQTSGLKNLTDTCDKYGLVWPIPNGDMFDEECGVRLVEYFWRDGLHPTSAIHEVVAEQVSRMLQEPPTVCL